MTFQTLKLSAASCGEPSILGEQSFGIRSLTPEQAAGNALAIEFILKNVPSRMHASQRQSCYMQEISGTQ
jgi:hypothetical protein